MKFVLIYGDAVEEIDWSVGEVLTALKKNGIAENTLVFFTSKLAHMMDLFPTALALAGAPLPQGVTLDGTNLAPLLFESKPMPARPFFYYRGDRLFACRLGEWKAHFQTQNGYGQPKVEPHDPPLLFHLGRDASEKRDVAAQHADVLARTTEAVNARKAGVVPGTPQLQ